MKLYFGIKFTRHTATEKMLLICLFGPLISTATDSVFDVVAVVSSTVEGIIFPIAPRFSVTL
jgi:hypothetical protein